MKKLATYEVTLRRDVQQVARVRVDASSRREASSVAESVVDNDAWSFEAHLGAHTPQVTRKEGASGKLRITEADCRSCGACCVANGDGGNVLAYGYADLTSKDVARMSPRVRRQLHEVFVGGETRYATRAKQLASGSVGCQHLRGTPGQRCSCSIYATRPEVCQRFRVGGEMCRAARLVLFGEENTHVRP